MSPGAQGTLVLVATLLMLMSGIPVAFGLGAVSIVFLLFFHGVDSMRVVAETFYAGLDDFTLVAIPMFVMMGAAIGSSPAGKDLYEALDRWLYRVPGGLVISNLGACAIFAALTGSSPACCAAIGKMGIPEMRRRGYPDDVATGSICAGGTLGILIPPSITFILYGIATETSIGRLFLAGVMPGLMLTGFFMIWTIFIIWKRGFRSHAIDFRYSWKEKFQSIPKIAPFILIIFGVMYSLYGGVATPSEAAGVGAALCLIMAILIYRLWKPEQIWHILRDTMRESVMILTIIAAAVLFGYMLTSLYLTQMLAQAIADAHFNRWVLMGMINLFLLVCGFFIPPAAIILMTSPILLPIITAAGFDPVWFGVILTINMEIGLIHPPVGLNIYIVNAIAPDVPVTTVMWGTMPYVLCMMLAIVILCYLSRNSHMVAGPSDGCRQVAHCCSRDPGNRDEHLVLRRTAADHLRARPRACWRATGAARRRPAPRAWSSCARICCPAAARPPASRARAKSSAAMANSPPGRASPSSRRWRERFGPDPARMEAAIAAWRAKPSDDDRRRSACRLRAAPAGAVPPAQSRARRHRGAGAHARAIDGRARSPRRSGRGR